MRGAEKNRNTLEHETEASRMRNRSAASKRQAKPATTLASSKSTSNLPQKGGFKVAMKHKATASQDGELPSLT